MAINYNRYYGIDRIFDVRNYGPVGDSVNGDNVTINRAIADVIASGFGTSTIPATLYFPFGDYYIKTNSIEIRNRYINLSGKG